VPDEKQVTVIIGNYGSVDDASQDLDFILAEREEHLISTFDGAVVSKDEDGHVRIVRKHETPVRFGAWGGMVVGGLIGLLFPPLPLMLQAGAVGAAAGSVVGHFWKGMSRTDIKDLGEALERDAAALVIAVDSASADETRSIMGRATGVTMREVGATATQIDHAIAEAADATS